MKRTDLTNRQVGRLTVKNFVGMQKNGHAQWGCLCECGNTKIVLATHLVQGKIQSCGCLPTRESANPVELFWSYVEKTDACWIWTGQRTKKGYGVLHTGQVRHRAHRFSFFVKNGYWPEPCCLHSCHNPPCVNPNHLRAGTNKENVEDRLQRQRELASGQ